VNQFIRYLLVGGLNFIFTAVVYWFFLRVLNVYYPVSFSISWLSGVILTFFINIHWVFQPGEIMGFKKRFLKYFIVYVCSYLVNLILLKTGVSLFKFDPFWYQFILIPMVVVINFTGIKLWALK
jgi:putative flippase GtrA